MRIRPASLASSNSDLRFDGGVVGQLTSFSTPKRLERAVKGGGFPSFGFGGGLGWRSKP